MATLSSYATQVQDLLHDPTNQFWSPTQITNYINESRNRVAQDTKALRTLVGQSAGQTLNLVIGQDFYTPQTFLPAPFGQNLVDVMGIALWWGTRRIKLNYFAYTRFDAAFRQWSNATYTGRPVAFTRMGATNVVIGPPPDQAYPTDWDIAVIPPALVAASDVDTIPVPFQEPVQYFAAYKAKWAEQAQGEALLFLKQYMQCLQWCLRSYQTRIIQNPYRIAS